jgi:DNA transposition AAA+ family ATPase
MTISEQLRDAIEGSGLTRYAIAKGAGVDYDALARFLDDGRDMRISNIEKLTAFFGMHLTAPKIPATKQLAR